MNYIVALKQNVSQQYIVLTLAQNSLAFSNKNWDHENWNAKPFYFYITLVHPTHQLPTHTVNFIEI